MTDWNIKQSPQYGLPWARHFTLINTQWKESMAATTTHGLFTGGNLDSPNTSPTKAFPRIQSDLSRLRQTTCNLCRERKVRCDRDKPECGRCKRIGHACTYPSSGGQTAVINSVLQNLHSRLSKHIWCLRGGFVSFPKLPCKRYCWPFPDWITVETETKLRAQYHSTPSNRPESGYVSEAPSAPPGPSVPNEIELGDFGSDVDLWWVSFNKNDILRHGRPYWDRSQ